MPYCFGRYLLLYFMSPLGAQQIKRFDNGSAQPNLSANNVRLYTVPLCSLPEQREIVRLLDEQFEVIERNEQEIDTALRKSEALRQAILKKAFTGRLVPQDPADEPASVLLARIRSERASVAGKTRRIIPASM